MGDPKKPKKQYKKPGHPWEAARIKEELQLKKEYGLANKKEIWKASSKLRNWRTQARQIVSLQEDLRNESEKALVSKLHKLGMLAKDAKIDDILALDLRTVLDRRLQSQVYALGLVNSSKQARQFIIHSKITVNDKVIAAPSYLVNSNDKVRLIEGFAPIIKKVVELKQKVMEKQLEKAAEQKTNAEVVEEVAMKATKEAKA